MMVNVSIPYGRTALDCEIPQERLIGVFRP